MAGKERSDERRRSGLVEKEKFCVVVVTYFPDEASLRNLEVLCRKCDALVIVDNTPEPNRSSFSESNNATVIRMGMNVGLAAALNRGVRFAGKAGFENIFLFDQDSRQPEAFFENMMLFKSRVDGVDNNCGFYVPDFFDRNSKTFASFSILRRFTLRHRKGRDLASGVFDDAIMAVTSGTLLKYSVFKKVGPFREDFFIDFVDCEYCLRVYKRGYKIAVNCGVVLDHSIGIRSKRRFLMLTVKPNFHAPLRRYYIARNGVKSALEFGYDRPVYFAFVFARLCHEILSVILYEDGKKRKTMAIAYGLIHGFAGRMGPCPVRSLADGERRERKADGR